METLRAGEVVGVLILAEVEVSEVGEIVSCSAEMKLMLAALQQAVRSHSLEEGTTERATATQNGSSRFVQVIPSTAIQTVEGDDLICPLTLEVPRSLEFWGKAIYQTCRDVEGLRQWVRQECSGAIGEGNLWLPIVLTAKGPLYGEVIGQGEVMEQDKAIKVIKTGSDADRDAQYAQQSMSGVSLQKPQAQTYYQPLHLPDRLRQPLYWLGGRLLRSHAAPPAVYLLQFGLRGDNICFDRLFPFPAAPAIASIGVQLPNLFTCHWRCITSQPIQDLVIPSTQLPLPLNPAILLES